MRRRHSIESICSVLAVFALAVSAVGGCACAHHKTEAVEKKASSCHSASHEQQITEIADGDPSMPRYGEQCSCNVNRVQAAVIAKSEQKKFKSQQTDAAGTADSLQLDDELLSTAEVPDFHSVPDLYTKSPPRLRASRAPPRL